jgi:hypothetical protein
MLTFLRDQIVFSPRLVVSSFAKGFKRTLMGNGSHVKISAEQMSMHLGYWKDPCTRRNRQSTGKQVEEEQTYISYFVKSSKISLPIPM